MATYEENVSQQAKVAAEKKEVLERAKNTVQAMVESGAIAASGQTDAKRVEAYVAPVERNYRELARAGQINQVRDPNSPTGFRDASRIGDVFVEFVDGICVVEEDDPDFEVKLSWLKTHPDLCRDIRDPFTEAWAFLKESQTETASQSARLPLNIDIERILAGDASGNRVPHGTVERARDRMQSLEK